MLNFTRINSMYRNIAIIVLSICLIFFIKDAYDKGKENKQLKQEIVNYNESMKTSVKVITEIKEKIKYVKDDCDCYHARIPDAIIDRVRKNK